jgi:hypothetical protein
MKNFRIFASLCLLLCLGGFAMAQTPNASSSTPAAPAGGQNCQFQSSGVNFSCYIPSGVYDVFGAATTAVATERATAANAGNLSSGTIPLSRLPGSGVTTISGTSCTIGGSCSPAGGGGGSTSDAKRIVYQQNCWTSLSDFTVVGTSPTPALCGIPLSVAGGTGTSTAQNLMLTASTNDGENEVVNVSYTLTNILGPGFDIAKQGINTMTHPFGLSVRIDPSTNTGYLEFLPTLQATNGTRNVLTSKALSVVMAAGDNIQILIYRSGTYIDAAINDITQQTTDIITYKYPQGTFATATNTVANSGQWGFFDEGGAVNVTNFSVAALDVASPAVCFVGDSKTVGSQFAADFRQRWAANLGIFGTTAIFAGGGDGTAEVLADLPQIVAAGCQKVLLNIGRNPVCNGVTTATWEAPSCIYWRSPRRPARRPASTHLLRARSHLAHILRPTRQLIRLLASPQARCLGRMACTLTLLATGSFAPTSPEPGSLLPPRILFFISPPLFKLSIRTSRPLRFPLPRSISIPRSMRRHRAP